MGNQTAGTQLAKRHEPGQTDGYLVYFMMVSPAEYFGISVYFVPPVGGTGGTYPP